MFLSLCGVIASMFTERDNINFGLIQMAVAILLVALFVSIAAYWSQIAVWFRNRRQTG
jgi:hypothetical protein